MNNENGILVTSPEEKKEVWGQHLWQNNEKTLTPPDAPISIPVDFHILLDINTEPPTEDEILKAVKCWKMADHQEKITSQQECWNSPWTPVSPIGKTSLEPSGQQQNYLQNGATVCLWSSSRRVMPCSVTTGKVSPCSWFLANCCPTLSCPKYKIT